MKGFSLASLFSALLVFTPLALLAAILHRSPVLVFLFSAIAIIPLAKYIGDATNELTLRTHAGLGGFLNATFGNATELIVGVFALHAGLLEVVKASIIGSVLGNLLLVLGTAILCWWLETRTPEIQCNRRQSRRFNASRRGARTRRSLTLPSDFIRCNRNHCHVALCHHCRAYDLCVLRSAFVHASHA